VDGSTYSKGSKDRRTSKDRNGSRDGREGLISLVNVKCQVGDAEQRGLNTKTDT